MLPLLFPMLSHTAHADFYRGLNIFLALASALVLAVEQFAFSGKPRLPYSQLLCLWYGFLFILCCLGMTYIAQSNPKNTLTMYLLGLVTVAFLWDFEYFEALALAALTTVAFSVILLFSGISTEQILLNHCISFVIMTCFYVLSRVMYSYKVANFLQLQEIEARKLEIQKISQAKSEILGVVAHDLRSPFNNIEMIATLLQKGTASKEQEQQYLNLILTSCQSSRETINEILYLAREEQRDYIPLEKVNLTTLLQEVRDEWETQLQGTRDLKLSLPPTPLYANLNKERFHRIMNNLLSNAVKFTPHNGEIMIQARQTDKKLLLDIADKGIGIPEKFRGQLFDRFSKARRRGLKGEKSNGLGLSICRQLVEQHGGSIEVESEERLGTTFHIVLPVAF
ncbi:sensor histidine kinase [Rufibacter immobilis]|uniref:histidine kinase n=1 Tax=Rufibacter immobilis TaxID=1348778 RepID=A0A3M9MS51_9BACT|nr:HAMP domain-containing sensor histidine kinase [Rufibacter immobilis]RNI28340.1 sensor histidine kinase [Rufibacter immobilis]